MSNPLGDLTGRVFGRLRVVGPVVRVGSPSTKAWPCVCTCGTEKTVRQRSLILGCTRSCGCLLRENSSRLMTAMHYKHGLSRSSEYRSWVEMRRRMTRPKHAADYAGRGITMCLRWREFENFYSDMGPKPTLKHSLERIDNDGNYEPGNCKWATIAEQNDNKRTVRRFQYLGESLTITQIFKRYAPSWLPRRVLSYRLKLLSYSVEEALCKPLRKL